MSLRARLWEKSRMRKRTERFSYRVSAKKRKLRHSEINNAVTTFSDLPLDLVRPILNQLDQNDVISLSLVSKSFRSLITHTSIHKLSFNYIPSKSQFTKIFSQFTSLNRLVFRFADRVGPLLIALSKSQCQIEALELCNFTLPKPKHVAKVSGRLGMVKVLKLDWFVDSTEVEIIGFIRLFPSLEELDLKDCYVWTDAGIEELVSHVPDLRSINLNCNPYLTDKSLDVLGNCIYLEHISCNRCDQITGHGLSAFLSKRKNLKSLKVPGRLRYGAPVLAEAISCCENLTHLSIKGDFVTDNILSVIATSRSTLKSLKLGSQNIFPLDAYSYSMDGLAVIIRAFHGLTTLHISLPHWPSDHEMSELVKFLPQLKDVFLDSSVTIYATLFSLIHNCSLLERVCMHFRCRICRDAQRRLGQTGLRSSCHQWHSGYKIVPHLIRKNYSIQHIEFQTEPDSSLKEILKSLCPSLRYVRASLDE